jgi:hypothetical protein
MKGWLVGAVLAAGTAAVWSTHAAAQRHTPITVTRLYTGSDGLTHAEEMDVRLTPWGTLGGIERSDAIAVSGLQFERSAPTRANDWHTASRRQYVITLRGKGEIELTGGRKILLEPGRILLAEDTTGKGHLTRTVGGEDWIAVVVPRTGN